MMRHYWIVYKLCPPSRAAYYFKRKYLKRPIGDSGRWGWTFTGHAARFYDDAIAYQYAVKYKGNVEEVRA